MSFTFNEAGDLLVTVDTLGTHTSVHQSLPFLFNENYALLTAMGLSADVITSQGHAVTTDGGDIITIG